MNGIGKGVKVGVWVRKEEVRREEEVRLTRCEEQSDLGINEPSELTRRFVLHSCATLRYRRQHPVVIKK